MVIGSFLKNGFEAALSSKVNILSVWKEHFSVFCWFLKPFSGKVKQRIQSYLNQTLVIGSFLEKGFEATMSSKTNVLRAWKEHFSGFCKFLSGKVETIFWESEAKRSKLFKSKFGHKELLRKWFWSFLKLDVFEKSIFQFFANFWVTMLKPFSGKVRLSVQNYLN